MTLGLTSASGAAEAEGVTNLKRGSEMLAEDEGWNERTVSLTPPFFSWYWPEVLEGDIVDRGGRWLSDW